MDSDVRCNPVDSIGSSTESRVSHCEPPAFCSVSEGQRRLGEKEHRACSVTPDVALRVRTQGPSRIKPLGAETAERVVALTLGEPPGETTHWTGVLMSKVAGSA